MDNIEVTMQKLDGFKNSAHADANVRKGYLDWLCPKQEDKAYFLGAYMQANPDDQESISFIASSVDGLNPEVEEGQYEESTPEEIKLEPFNVLQNFMSLSQDLADLFKKGLMNLAEILKMKQKNSLLESKSVPKDNNKYYQPKPSKEKQRRKKKHIGKEKYRGEDVERERITTAQTRQKKQDDYALQRYNEQTKQRAMKKAEAPEMANQNQRSMN